MKRYESVILHLPGHARAIRRAADLFAAQYGGVLMQMRGSVLTEHGLRYGIQDWIPIVSLDLDLDILGLGEPGNSDEDLLWVLPTDSAELRLSTPMEDSFVDD